MQSVIIDIGNTRTKVYVFQNDHLVDEYNYGLGSKVNIKPLLDNDFSKVLVSAVGNLETRINLNDVSNIHLFNQESKLPIKINYETPSTLGLDRIANSVSVSGKKNNSLIIDIGTCVTFDLVDRLDVYQGGLIYPGVNMRFKSMFQQTDKLPDIDWRNKWNTNDYIGKSTIDSMVIGVKQSMIMEIEGLIHLYKEKFNDLQVYLTGGDSVYFEKELKSSIFANPLLGAKGLLKILQHNL